MQYTSTPAQREPISPIERRKRSHLRAVYGSYLVAWMVGGFAYLHFTGTWDESVPVAWGLGIFFGKSAAFWLVYGIYRWTTRNRPKDPVPIFCGDCHVHVSAVLDRWDGGYEFQCHNCGAMNVALSKNGARVVH